LPPYCPPANRNVDKYANARPPHPQIVAVRLDAPLFFANTLHFEHTIREYLAAAELGAASSEWWGGVNLHFYTRLPDLIRLAGTTRRALCTQ
jgi:hypothetical protein